MSLDPAAPSPASPEQRANVNIAELARRVAILERSGKGTSAWKLLNLVNSWTAGTGSERPASYWLDDNGVVHLGGVMVTPAGPPAPNTVVALMPAEATPAIYNAIILAQGSTGVNGKYFVNAAGELRTDPTTGQTAGNHMSLDGQAYRTI